MKGIIFDMDGTMIDNMMTHHRAWQYQLKQLGLDWPLEEVKEKVHGVNTEILERLFGDRFTPTEREQISQQKEATYREIFKSNLRLVNGLDELLEELKTAGIPMAVGTAAPVENVDFVLDTLGIRHFFRGVFHAGNVEKGKPDPEIFQKAAGALGLSPKDCLIFEDSVTGAETASRAGAKAIIITTTHGEEEFTSFTHIRKFAKDFTEISWPYLRKEFNFDG